MSTTLEQPTEGQIRRVLNAEYLAAPSGTQLKRKINQDGTRTPWTPVPASHPPAEDTSPVLMLVQEKQADGEPKHWYLFVAPGKGDGTKYQVTGDATFMRYEAKEDAPSPTSCPDYHTSFEVARLKEGQEDVMRRCAEAEAPPRAEDQASVRENCQG